MHVHRPKALEGWRDFLKEVGIIVLGVLIALGAEQIVDSWQWREKIDQAEAAMRLELAGDNGPQAYGRVLISSCLDQAIARIHDGAGQMPPDQLRRLTTAYSPPFRTWDSEAWKVVIASDIGSHMGPERLVAWSSPYRSLPMLSDMSERESALVVDLREAVPPSGTPSPADIASVRQTAAQLRMLNRRFRRASLLTLSRIGEDGAQVSPQVQRELTAEARAMYGSCVTVPDLGAAPEAEGLKANLSSGSLNGR